MIPYRPDDRAVAGPLGMIVVERIHSETVPNGHAARFQIDVMNSCQCISNSGPGFARSGEAGSIANLPPGKTVNGPRCGRCTLGLGPLWVLVVSKLQCAPRT